MWLQLKPVLQFQYRKKNTPAENVSISFENISTTATVAIKEASTGASGNSAPENVLVSVPQLDTAPKFAR